MTSKEELDQELGGYQELREDSSGSNEGFTPIHIPSLHGMLLVTLPPLPPLILVIVQLWGMGRGDCQVGSLPIILLHGLWRWSLASF